MLAQGLAAPFNLEALGRMDAAIRKEGAVPALTGVHRGRLCVGQTPGLVAALTARDAKVHKVGMRELGEVLASEATGATTVSATCLIAARVGIRYFATGGIGGVHRDFEKTHDASQDLRALARFPVAVVCAGAKLILDLPRTLESLETLGVPVYGFGTSSFPGFYVTDSGLEVACLPDVKACAAAAEAHWSLGGSGVVVAVPPPRGLPRATLERALEAALRLARKQRVRGKAVTPFLLRRLALATRGESVAANLALLERNAEVAARLARTAARSAS